MLLTADSFNRTNSTTSLGSTDGAGWLDPILWTQAGAVSGIISNAAYRSAISADAVNVVEVYSSDLDMSITTSTIVATSTCGLVFRYTAVSNYWMAVSTVGNTYLIKRSASTNTIMATIAGPASGDVLRVVAVGNSIKLYRNGILIADISDSFQATGATKAGWFSEKETCRLDDFSVSTTPSGVVLASDSFNRLNNSVTIGSTDGIGTLDPLTWTYLDAGMSDEISSNMLRDLTGITLHGVTFVNVAVVDLGTPDVDIAILTPSSLNTSSVIGIAFRVVDKDNFWYVRTDVGITSGFVIIKVVANVATTMADLGAITAPQILRILAYGSTIKFYGNGALMSTITDTQFNTATKHGAFNRSSSGHNATTVQWIASEGPIAIPVVSNVGPSFGYIEGGETVTLLGQNFTAATAVKFGATDATSFTIVADNRIRCVAPAHAAGLTNVTVTSPLGTSEISAPNQYTFLVSAPSVASVTPNFGPIAGGTSVVITGAHFTGTTSVTFGVTNATSFTVDNDGQITAVAPAHVSGTIDVIVTTPLGSSS